ncbi:hypothetical protein [Streptomyces sp. NPDC088794]|uniref:hypothetical protein n=1 Tax=Streptomyces sp. NPDC088794 TaxID=3365902 RepID=UPI0037F7334E
MVMNIVGLVGWPVVWFGLLYVLIGYLSPGFAWLFALPLCYVLYRAVIQLRYISTALRMVRVLQHYPWQLLHRAPRGLDRHPEAEDDGIWIEFPDPVDDRERGIPLTFVKHYRAYWWLRRIGGPRTKPGLKARLEPLWFAGDPRFLGVLAVSARGGKAPRRLHFLYRPSALDPRAERRRWQGATPADLEVARRAGARFAEASPTSVDTAAVTGQES